MQTLWVDWARCEPGYGCPLETVDLNYVTAAGVYLIWVGTRAVYVGQGNIGDRIREHRNPTTETGRQILPYGRYGVLLVTWAEVHQHYRDGVEVYLANTFKPLIGVRHPDAVPISVNLP